MVLGRCVVILIAGGAVLGCGGNGDSGAGVERPVRTAAPPAPAEQLPRVPRSVVGRCAAEAPRRDIPVLCPTRLPNARGFARYQTLAHSRSEYLTDLQGSGDPFHVLAGGRRGRFSLTTTTDGRWPVEVPAPSATCCATAPRDLGLIGARPGERSDTWESVRLKLLRRTAVAQQHALLLTAADYPDGGIHGGHLVVVWNQGDAGYALSMHFAARSERTRGEQLAVLAQAATVMSQFVAPNTS
jgi:hypothetical protein